MQCRSSIGPQTASSLNQIRVRIDNREMSMACTRPVEAETTSKRGITVTFPREDFFQRARGFSVMLVYRRTIMRKLFCLGLWSALLAAHLSAAVIQFQVI